MSGPKSTSYEVSFNWDRRPDGRQRRLAGRLNRRLDDEPRPDGEPNGRPDGEPNSSDVPIHSPRS